jgi:hypothetical protein
MTLKYVRSPSDADRVTGVQLLFYISCFSVQLMDFPERFILCGILQAMGSAGIQAMGQRTGLCD